MGRSDSLLLLFGFLALTTATESPARSIGAAANWVAHGADADETNFSQLDQIKAANVKGLGLGWSLDLPGEVSLEATPLAVNGVLYFTGSYGGSTRSTASAASCCGSIEPETWKHNPAKMRFSFAVNRGAAYADGRIFSARSTADCSRSMRTTASCSGACETTAPESHETITGAPRDIQRQGHHRQRRRRLRRARLCHRL